jgi:hypothetical protein
MSDLLNSASLVMIPSGYKEDIVYSAVPTDGSGDLSFTRASNGTRVNSAGLVEVVAWNLLQYSEIFTNAIWTANSNTITANTTTAPNGTTTADTFTLVAGADASVYQAVNGVSNNYTTSVYAKYVSGDKYLYFFSQLNSQGAKVWFDIQNGTVSNQLSGFTGTIENVGNGWYKCSMYNTTASDSDYIQFGISTTNLSRVLSNNSVAYFWGAQVNVGTAKPYFPTTDRLNVPRLTYQNGGGGCPSLLLEKQSTNLFTYSEQLDNAAWTKNNTTVTANATTSPDGTINADKIADSINTSSAFYFYQSPATTSTQYTSSGYFKKGEYNFVTLHAFGINGAVFNLNTGVLVSQSGGTGTIQSVGDGWYRCTFTFTAGGSSVFFSQSPAGNISYTGTIGSGIYGWGLQCEASSYVTSLIQTTSASATRVADYTSRSGLALTNFTFAVNFKPLDYIVELFDFQKTGGGRMFYVAVQSSGFITFNGVSGGTIGAIGPIIPKLQTCKLAFKLNASTSNLTVFINGSNIGTYTTNITTFGAFFGLQSFGYNPGTQIEQIAIFPSVLTDAECISLTS